MAAEVVGSFAFAVTLGVLPQALLILVAGVIAVVGAVRAEARPSLHRWLSCIGLGGALAAALILLYGIRLGKAGVGLIAYGGGLVVDRFSVLGTVVLILVALLAVGIGIPFSAEIRRRAAAFHALVLIATAAASLLAAEREMLALFVTLQLLLLATALLAALAKTSRRAAEAAIKHLVLGAVGSAILLQGLAILYGLTGSSDLAAVPAAYARSAGVTSVGMALTLLGLAVVLGVVPLQHSLGQVARGTPAAVGGFVTTVSVVAGLLVYLRITVGGFGAASRPWMDLTAVIACATLLLSSLAALRARSARCLAAHLVAGQVGMLLVGVLSVSQGTDHRAGIVALLVGAMALAVTALAAAGVIGLLEGAGALQGGDDHRGLALRAGPDALVLAVSIASLAGLPPTALFVARVLLLESAVAAGYAWVAVVAAVAAVLTAAAGARFIAELYSRGGAETRIALGAPWPARAAVWLCATSGVAFTVIVQPLLAVSSGGAGTLPTP